MIIIYISVHFFFYTKRNNFKSNIRIKIFFLNIILSFTNIIYFLLSYYKIFLVETLYKIPT